MKRHRHSAVFEWHASTHVVPYIHLDRVEVRAQQGYVVHVSETSGHPVTVTSANRKGAQQRRESVTHYTRLHDVRVEVEGVESTGRTGDDVAASGSLATGSRNPNMVATALWYGTVNRVFAVMCNVIF